MTPWEIKAKEFANCNCAYGCPCQFNALPTHGHCEAAVAFEIEQGHYGDVKLDGLRMGGVYQWPGAVHEGRGKCQPFVDERADEKQREALLKIMTGQDTDPMATMFAVYFSTCEKVYDPIFAKIEFDVDVEASKDGIAWMAWPRARASRSRTRSRVPSIVRASTFRMASSTRLPRSAAARRRRKGTSCST